MSNLYAVEITDNVTYQILVQAEDEEEARQLANEVPEEERERFRIHSLYYVEVLELLESEEN